jgi:acid stress-induced BolA-like protein IbaG/YrbA
MSGGHFNYKQYDIGHIADEVEQIIIDNNSTEEDEYGDIEGYHFTPEIIDEFKQGLKILRQAQVYAQRIDWLVSGDDGPESFLKRLQHDLKQLENNNG